MTIEGIRLMSVTEKNGPEIPEIKRDFLPTRLFLVFVIVGIIISISLGIALDIRARIIKGEKAQDAMAILDNMRAPLYKLKDSPFKLLSAADTDAAVRSFNETLIEADSIIDRYVELYECSPGMYTCASMLKQDYDDWSGHARHILLHFSRLLRTSEVGEDDYSHFVYELVLSSAGFVKLMKHFEDGEILLHKDMDDGHRANHMLLRMVIVFILYNATMIALYHKSREAHRINVLKKEVEERKTAEARVRDSRRQLRQLASHMQSVQENERAAIAKDIHDELGQILTALHFELSFISKNMPPEDEFFDDKSKAVSALVTDAIETVQRISSELHPRVLDDLGLVAAIESYVREYRERTGIECKLIFDPEEIDEDKELDIAIYRAVQESLTNVARHADATKVSVCLCKSNDILELEIIDNGKGITEEEVCSRTSFGLLGIKERFIPFGAKVTVEGIEGEGTTVMITVPVREEL